jgi:hypothetical protein
MPTHSPNPPIAPVAPADAAVWLKIANRHWSAWTVTPEQLAAHLGNHADVVGDWRIEPGDQTLQPAIRAGRPRIRVRDAMPAGHAGPA